MTPLSYRLDRYASDKRYIISTNRPGTRRSLTRRIRRRIDVSIRIPSNNSSPAREEREQRRLCENGSGPNCNRYVVHGCISNASSARSRLRARAQSQQWHSRKLPSSLHIHHRNVFCNSKLGKNRRPSKGKIVTLRLTFPVVTMPLLFGGFNRPPFMQDIAWDHHCQCIGQFDLRE